MPEPRKKPQGLLTPGNVDLSAQPVVKNADGSTSTVHSFSVNLGNGEILLPTVTPDGRHLSQSAAIDEYRKTGRHLGVFDTPDNATAYARRLHHEYEAGMYRAPAQEASACRSTHSKVVLMPNPSTTWTKNVTTDDDYLPVNMRSVPTGCTLAPALYPQQRHKLDP